MHSLIVFFPLSVVFHSWPSKHQSIYQMCRVHIDVVVIFFIISFKIRVTEGHFYACELHQFLVDAIQCFLVCGFDFLVDFPN